MARYRGSDADLAYGEPPGPSRWDSGRFNRESEYRRAPVIEQRPPYEAARRREPVTYDDRRFYEEDYRSGPRGSRDRQFYEEDEYYDPRGTSGAMVPYRPDPPPRPAPPARPRMMRRQSSVDRVDFERRRYYDDQQYRPPPPPPRDARNSRYEINIYDDVKVQDQDRYGDDSGFREYREREWTRSRTRNDDPSPDRRAPSSRASTFIDAAPHEFHEEIIEKREEKITEKPYPRRGKTRMPKRLVHTKVLFDLGYPFYEEDEKTILIQKALGPDNIDEIFAKSKEYLSVKTQMIEAPPASAKSISEAPRSVRDWDNFARSPSPGSSISQVSRKSGRRARSVASRRESVHESIHESGRKSRHGDGDSFHESFHEDIHRDVHRSPSPAQTARTARSRKSRARSRGTRRSESSETIVERKIIENDYVDTSNRVDTNFPLSLAIRGKEERTDAEIRDEIRRLELERREIRRDSEVVRYDRRRDLSPVGVLREPSPRGEIIIADRSDNRRDPEVVAVRKDKRARSRSRPPTAGLLKSMMYTVT